MEDIGHISNGILAFCHCSLCSFPEFEIVSDFSHKIHKKCITLYGLEQTAKKERHNY